MRLRQCQPPLAVDADYSRVADLGLPIHVLVAVDEPPRTRTFDVGDESIEAKVNVVVAVVNIARGVVRDEDIGREKRNHQLLNLRLLVTEMSAWLVAARAVETAEAHSVNGMGGEVKINDGWWERLTAVVVAFDRARMCGHWMDCATCRMMSPT